MSIFSKKELVIKKTYAGPLKRTLYPNGSVVVTIDGYFYIRGNKRYRIISDRVLLSWSFPKVIQSTEFAVEHLRVSGKLGFRDGTLINNVADGKLYLISENKRRPITNPDWLTILNFDIHEALVVSDEEANLHEDGVELK